MTFSEPYVRNIGVTGSVLKYLVTIKYQASSVMTNPCLEQPSYRLSIEQLAELQQAFNEFDMDGDNFISTKELGWAMRAMGMNPTEVEILQLINRVGMPEILLHYIY